VLYPMAGPAVNLEGPARVLSGEGMPDMPPAAIQHNVSQNGLPSSDGALPGKPAGKSDFPAIGISATSAEPQKLNSPWKGALGPNTLPPVVTPAPTEEPRGSATQRDDQAAAEEAAAPSECQNGVVEQPATVKVEGQGAEGVGGLPDAPGLVAEVAIERLEGLLRRLGAEHDPESFFQERVLKEQLGCENYYEKIKNPMWFSLIRAKVNTPSLAKSMYSDSLDAHQQSLEQACWLKEQACLCFVIIREGMVTQIDGS